MVQGLGLCIFTLMSMGSIPGLGTKMPHAIQCSQTKQNFSADTNNHIHTQPSKNHCTTEKVVTEYIKELQI